MSGNEQKRIAEVFETNFIAPVGPHLAMFEERFAEYVGVEHALAVVSGTAAIHLALRYLGLRPGDEVICSTFTFCASANPIIYEGAKPVFLDSDWTSWNMDPNLLADELKAAAASGRLPKAILVVDILGQCADLAAIQALAGRYDIPVIEDAAEALGGTYRGRSAGSTSWCGTFSFNGNKIITTSGGGMLCSNDPQLVEQARFFSTQAREPLPYYQHETYGYNYRMSNVLAAIGIAQLEVLDERVQARKDLFHYYRRELADLPGISFMPIAEFGEPNYWLSSFLVDPTAFGATCEDLRQALEAENIEARRVWQPLHRQPVFANCRCRGGAVADQIFAQGLCLPSGSAMTSADRRRVTDAVLSFHQRRQSG